MLKSILAVTLFVPAMAFATPQEEQATIRKLLPAGTDIAQAKELAQLSKQDSPEDIAKALTANYIFADFDKDGHTDLLVVVEKDPSYQNGETGKPCTPAGSDDYTCTMMYGNRALQFYRGQADGSLKLDFSNPNMVYNANDGGVSGDPLGGISMDTRGVIRLEVSGGDSSFQWDHRDIFQYRKDDFYLTGEYDYSYDAAGPAATAQHSTDVDYITGREVNIDHGKRQLIQNKPKALVKVRDYVNKDVNQP